MKDVVRKVVQYQKVAEDSDGQRLDNYLLKILKGVPKSHIYRIIRSGEVRVNMKRAKPLDKLFIGDEVRIPPIRTSKEQAVSVTDGFASKLLDSIIYEDDKFLVVNKPSGMAVHGGSGLSFGVIEALRKLRPELDYLELAHRLDKETSGCLVLVKKRSQLRALQSLLEQRKVQKVYWAMLQDRWHGPTSVIIDAPLQKNILTSGERVVKVSDLGKDSASRFKLLENYEKACMVEVTPKTGRTHQIRVHSSYIGHPILGDAKYGQKKEILLDKSIKMRLCLHANSISFKLNDKEYLFEAIIDEAFANIRSMLRDEKAI